MTKSADLVGLADRIHAYAGPQRNARLMNVPADMLHKWAAELRALAGAEVGGWRSMEDAPKDGTRFLALTNSGYPIILSWISEMKTFANNNWKEYTNVACWMPIPPPGSGRGGVNNSTNDEER